MVNAGMNQIKDQAMELIPNELQDKKDEKNPEEKDSKLNVDGKEDKIKQKKPKRNPITKTLAIKLFSILLFHTLIITLILFIFVRDKNAGFTLLKLIIFLSAFIGGIILSLIVIKLKVYQNFI